MQHESTCVEPARLDWTNRPRASRLARHTGVSRWLSHTAVRIAVNQARESAVPERLRIRCSTHARPPGPARSVTIGAAKHSLWRATLHRAHKKGRRGLMQQRSAKKGSRPPALQRAVRESGRVGGRTAPGLLLRAVDRLGSHALQSRPARPADRAWLCAGSSTRCAYASHCRSSAAAAASAAVDCRGQSTTLRTPSGCRDHIAG